MVSVHFERHNDDGGCRLISAFTQSCCYVTHVSAEQTVFKDFAVTAVGYVKETMTLQCQVLYSNMIQR